MQGKTIIQKYCKNDFLELADIPKYGYKHRKGKKYRKYLAKKAKRRIKDDIC